jgi:hypothetical protein
MTVRWRWTHDRDPRTRERGDGGAVDRDFPKAPKRYEDETLGIDGIEMRQRSVHSGKITLEKIERRSAKTPETRTLK